MRSAGRNERTRHKCGAGAGVSAFCDQALARYAGPQRKHCAARGGRRFRMQACGSPAASGRDGPGLTLGMKAPAPEAQTLRRACGHPRAGFRAILGKVASAKVALTLHQAD